MDTLNRHGTLLEVIQAVTDLNLMITKAYMSSDGGWFMDGMLIKATYLKNNNKENNKIYVPQSDWKFNFQCFM